MKIINEEQKLKILALIKEGIEKDMSNFEGKPMNGKNVSILFGQQGAAIDALANIITNLIKET